MENAQDNYEKIKFMRNLISFLPPWVKNMEDLSKYIRHILLRVEQSKQREGILFDILNEELDKFGASKEYKFQLIEFKLADLKNESTKKLENWADEAHKMVKENS